MDPRLPVSIPDAVSDILGGNKAENTPFSKLLSTRRSLVTLIIGESLLILARV